jgi:hypothetical protein
MTALSAVAVRMVVSGIVERRDTHEVLSMIDSRPRLVRGPGALLRARRAQLICYPGVYYAAPPSGDRAERPDAAEPAST